MLRTILSCFEEIPEEGPKKIDYYFKKPNEYFLPPGYSGNPEEYYKRYFIEGFEECYDYNYRKKLKESHRWVHDGAAKDIFIYATDLNSPIETKDGGEYYGRLYYDWRAERNEKIIPARKPLINFCEEEILPRLRNTEYQAGFERWFIEIKNSYLYLTGSPFIPPKEPTIPYHVAENEKNFVSFSYCSWVLQENGEYLLEGWKFGSDSELSKKTPSFTRLRDALEKEMIIPNMHYLEVMGRYALCVVCKEKKTEYISFLKKITLAMKKFKELYDDGIKFLDDHIANFLINLNLVPETSEILKTDEAKKIIFELFQNDLNKNFHSAKEFNFFAFIGDLNRKMESLTQERDNMFSHDPSYDYYNEEHWLKKIEVCNPENHDYPIDSSDYIFYKKNPKNAFFDRYDKFATPVMHRDFNGDCKRSKRRAEVLLKQMNDCYGNCCPKNIQERKRFFQQMFDYCLKDEEKRKFKRNYDELQKKVNAFEQKILAPRDFKDRNVNYVDLDSVPDGFKYDEEFRNYLERYIENNIFPDTMHDLNQIGQFLAYIICENGEWIYINYLERIAEQMKLLKGQYCETDHIECKMWGIEEVKSIDNDINTAFLNLIQTSIAIQRWLSFSNFQNIMTGLQKIHRERKKNLEEHIRVLRRNECSTEDDTKKIIHDSNKVFYFEKYSEKQNDIFLQNLKDRGGKSETVEFLRCSEGLIKIFNINIDNTTKLNFLREQILLYKEKLISLGVKIDPNREKDQKEQESSEKYKFRRNFTFEKVWNNLELILSKISRYFENLKLLDPTNQEENISERNSANILKNIHETMEYVINSYLQHLRLKRYKQMSIRRMFSRRGHRGRKFDVDKRERIKKIEKLLCNVKKKCLFFLDLDPVVVEKLSKKKKCERRQTFK